MIKLNPIEITATSQTYAAEITEKLCKPFCENSTVQPVVDGAFTIEDVWLVGDTEYVRVKAQGTITYIPQCGCKCCPSSQIATEELVVAFIGVTEEKIPTVTFEAAKSFPANVNCYGVAKGLSLIGALTVKIPA